MSTNASQNQPQKLPPADYKQHVLYKHVMALLQVQTAAAEMINALHPTEYSPEEKKLAAALADMHLAKEKDVLLLGLIEQLLRFVLPGEDIIGDGIGLSNMMSDKNERAIAIVITIQPGKNVIRIMSRKTAENFETGLKKILDEHFGRIITL